MACYCERFTARAAGISENVRKMDGEAYRREHGAGGSKDVRISSKGWVGILSDGTYKEGCNTCGPDRCCS